MKRKGFLIGFLAGGWLATILIVLLPHLGLVSAQAEDPPGPEQPAVRAGQRTGRRTHGEPVQRRFHARAGA